MSKIWKNFDWKRWVKLSEYISLYNSEKFFGVWHILCVDNVCVLNFEARIDRFNIFFIFYFNVGWLGLGFS